MTFLRNLLAAFRSGAKTIGVSPKILGAGITAVITAALNLFLSKVGLTLQELADAIGTSPQYIVGAQLIAGATIASILLPPGLTTDEPETVDGVMEAVVVTPPTAR